MLVRPLNVFFQFCFDYFNFIGFTDLIPGVTIFIYGCIASAFQFTFTNTVKLIIVIIGATLLRGGIFTITGSLAFWTKRSRSLIDINLTLFDYTMRYPINIYPNLLQGIFTFIIPLGFISFYPATELLNIKTGFNKTEVMDMNPILLARVRTSVGLNEHRNGIRVP
jgi:ABC-2 type transport system permease protein